MAPISVEFGNGGWTKSGEGIDQKSFTINPGESEIFVGSDRASLIVSCNKKDDGGIIRLSCDASHAIRNAYKPELLFPKPVIIDIGEDGFCEVIGNYGTRPLGETVARIEHISR